MKINFKWAKVLNIKTKAPRKEFREKNPSHGS